MNVNVIENIAFVQWDITQRCNLNCLFCRQAATRELSDDLTIEDFAIILDQFPELGVKHLSIAGGEPLMFMHLEELLTLACSKVEQVSLLTNGTLVDEFKATMLAEKLRYVQVSIDGLGSAHDAIRCSGSFEKTINGIKLLKKAGLRVYVRATVFKDNVDQIIPIMHWCKANAVDAFVCRRVIPSGRGDTVDLLSPLQLKKLLLQVEDVGKEIGLRVEYGDPFPDLLIRKERRQEADMDHEVLEGSLLGGCSVGLDSMYITQNGTVCLCPYLPIFCGDLRKQSLKDIWQNSETYQKIRSLRYNLQGKCGKCEYRFACGGCRAVAYFNTGNICAEDNGCWHQIV